MTAPAKGPSPGPWTTNGHYILDADCRIIAAAQKIDGVEANARLIAAAPDMLAALLQLMIAYGVELSHDPHPPHSDRHKAWAAAGEAVAKATGVDR
jgi:hypothetical protein